MKPAATVVATTAGTSLAKRHTDNRLAYQQQTDSHAPTHTLPISKNRTTRPRIKAASQLSDAAQTYFWHHPNPTHSILKKNNHLPPAARVPR
jgi:hypothetical protein